MDPSYFQIDQLALDKECLAQPHLILQATHAVADARAELDKARAKSDLYKAKTAKDIRDNPDKYGLVKATEMAVQEALTATPGYKEHEKASIKARHRLEIANGEVTALEHKKRSLELLVQLHGTGYYGDPHLGSEGKQAMQTEAQKQVRTGTRLERK